MDTDITLTNCPICNQKMPANPRYPDMVCSECFHQAADEKGNYLKFFNDDATGGLVILYATGEERISRLCYINGVACVADEAHMGGVGIQVLR